MSCPVFPDPDTSNVCSNALGDLYSIPNFCTLEGVGGDSYRQEYCSALGSFLEWSVQSDTGPSSCSYNDCRPFQEYSGCCEGCCAITGSGVVCRRSAFNGDPIQCCFNNVTCRGDPALCWSDVAEKNTCDPNNRSITGPACQQTLLDYCTGVDVTDPNDLSWMDRWRNPVDGSPVPFRCLYNVTSNVLATDTNPCGVFIPPGTCTGVTGPFSSEGVSYATKVVQGAFEKFASNGFVIGSLPGSPTFNDFQDFLYNNVCCNFPQLCSSGLKSVCSVYTAQRLTFNPAAVEFCGCYLPDGEYARYIDQFQVNKECTPMCNRIGNIPLTNGDGTELLCTQNVCIIDDINIQLTKTSANGDIDISQLCGSCDGPSKSCTCIIQNDTFLAADSSIGGGIDLSQQCSSGTCVRPGPNTSTTPPTVNVGCDQPANFDPFAIYNQRVQQAEDAALKQRDINIFIVVGIAVIVVIIAILIIRRK